MANKQKTGYIVTASFQVEDPKNGLIDFNRTYIVPSATCPTDCEIIVMNEIKKEYEKKNNLDLNKLSLKFDMNLSPIQKISKSNKTILRVESESSKKSSTENNSHQTPKSYVNNNLVENLGTTINFQGINNETDEETGNNEFDEFEGVNTCQLNTNTISWRVVKTSNGKKERK